MIPIHPGDCKLLERVANYICDSQPKSITPNEAQRLRELATLLDATVVAPHSPELEGTVPVVLYLANKSERDEFVDLIRQAKPNLVTRKL